MTISARIHYAALALAELAIQSQSANPIAASEISERHGIPGPFLVQILRTLRSAGWVQSMRGSQGGYRITISPSELTMLQVAEAVGCIEPACPVETSASPAASALNASWRSAHEASRAVLAETTLDQIVAAAMADRDAAMFYI
ncbi:MAG: Rrf2 family transcriptional regulator [Planctomycetota bacterium]